MRFTVKTIAIARAAAVLVLGAAVLIAQDATGKIAGNVTDQSGAFIAGAKVTVTNTATGLTKPTTTDKVGYYQVQQLPVGQYEVAAEAPGFARMVVSGKNPLEINQTLRIDVMLEVGSVRDTVTVEGGASAVETENATVGATVNTMAVYELPLNGRNTLDLLATQPGVTPKNADAPRQAGSYSVGGARSDSVTYLLDGGLNNHLIDNGVVINPNPDAVGEFRVLQSNYSAEYGRSGGGVVSVVTKSGTNTVHGTAFDYLRNEDFDANTFFNNEQGIERQILKRNQYGGTIGGPVIVPHVVDGRNSLFFFFSYEGQQQNANQQAGKVTTFTPLEAQGNFSKSVNGGPDAAVASFLESNSYFQPNPTLAAQGVIDPARISQVALNYFKNSLIPTSASGYLFPQATAKTNHNEYLGKIDYMVTSRDTLSATLAAQDSPTTVPFSGASGATTVSGYPVSDDVAAYFANIAFTHTFSPSIVDQARFTAQRNNNMQNYPIGTKPGPANLGIGITPDLVDGPTIINLEGSTMFAGYNPFGPANIVDNTFTFTDDLSWTKGAHSLKFGFYCSEYRDAMIYGYYLNGEFDFYGPGTSIGSGNDRADFLMGLPDDLQQYPNAPTNIRSHSFAGYAQDSWKVARRFTLNYGLRYEYNQPKYDTHGRSFSFVPGEQSTVFPNAPLGLLFPGDKDAPRGSNWPDRTNFAPRVGFAWDVFGNAKTSVRGGSGMFYDMLKAEDNLQFNGQTPFFSSGYLQFSAPDAGFTSDPGIMTDPYRRRRRAQPVPVQARESQRELRRCRFSAHRRRQSVLHRSESEDALHLPVQPHRAAATRQQPDAGGRLHRPFRSRSHRAYRHQPVPAGQRHPHPEPEPRLRGRLQLHERRSRTSAARTITGCRSTSPSVSPTRASAIASSRSPTPGRTRSTTSRVTGSATPLSPTTTTTSSAPRAMPTCGSSFPCPAAGNCPSTKPGRKARRLLTKGWTLYPIVTWRTGFPLDVLAFAPGTAPSQINPGPSGSGDTQVVRADLVAPIQYYNATTYQTVAGGSGGSAGRQLLVQPEQLFQRPRSHAEPGSR